MSLQYKHFSYGSEGLLTRYFKNITHVSKNSVLLDFTDTFLYRGKEKIDTHIFKLARWIPIYLQKKSISQKFLTLYNTLWKGNITSTLICLKKYTLLLSSAITVFLYGSFTWFFSWEVCSSTVMILHASRLAQIWEKTQRYLF